MILLFVLSLLFSTTVHAMEAPDGQEFTLEDIVSNSCTCFDGPIRRYVQCEIEEECLYNSTDRIERARGYLRQTTRKMAEMILGYGCFYIARCISSNSPQTACCCGSCVGCCGYVLHEKYQRIRREEVARRD